MIEVRQLVTASVAVAINRVTLPEPIIIVPTSITVAVAVIRPSVTISSIVILAGVAIAVGIVIVAASVPIPVVISTGIAIAGIVVPTGITVAIVAIVPSISVIIGTRESVGILSYRFPEFGMILQIGLQLGMTLHLCFIVDQLRISPKLLGNFAMAIEEAIEVDALFAHAVILVTLIDRFPMHECLWIFF